jgi:hypothetical protein
MSVLLLLKGAPISWATAAMYTQFFIVQVPAHLTVGSQHPLDCAVRVQLTGIPDIALQTYSVLSQERLCGVGVFRRRNQLRRAVQRSLRRRNISNF